LLNVAKQTAASSALSAQNEACSYRTFLLDYTNRGYMPAVKRQIIDLIMNGSGIRDTARVLSISTDTVISELKKRKPA
jgi:transposase-like protein